MSVGEEVKEQLGLGPQAFTLPGWAGAGWRRQMGTHPHWPPLVQSCPVGTLEGLGLDLPESP